MLFKNVIFFHFCMNNIPLSMLILGAFLIFGLSVFKIPFEVLNYKKCIALCDLEGRMVYFCPLNYF